MKISIVGTGYVALVTSTCFSELGVNVTCVDPDSQKINRLVYGALPIYEPGLEAMMNHNVNDGRLIFSADYERCFDDADVVFCAGDPTLNTDGSTDLSPIKKIALDFAKGIKKYSVFVLKTTVPAGTAKQIKEIIAEEMNKRADKVEFDVASNPDFLTEGNAIKDFMKPDRIVIGVENERAKEVLTRLYRPILLRNNSVIFTDTSTAEMIKYAATCMLATRISLMNEIANFCEVVGADANVVRHGVGTDSRIGPKYIYPGCGYGGAVDHVNINQKRVLFEKLYRYFGGQLKGKTVALWGLSFKPETDDMSEGPAIVTLDLLLKAGCKVRVYDPVTMNTAKLRWNDIYCGVDMYDAVKGADALLLITEWRQFHLPAWNQIKEIMKTPLVIDGRNIYDRRELEEMGFEYRCIGV